MASPLTVIIPCKNERENIGPCIDSVRGIADEILIADSGSTDGTLDIVRAIGGCRIIQREYVHSADFKNWAIPQATHDWVLIVDADERITPPLSREIRGILNEAPCAYDAFWIGRDNHYLGHRIKRCGWSHDGVIRLMRRDVCRYGSRWVHAEVDIAPDRVGRLQHRMLHFTTWSTDEYSEKLNRYAGWGARHFYDQGRRPSLLGLFFAAPFRFLQLYVLRLGFLDGAAGFQVCTYAAFYSFLKQAKLWEMHHACRQVEPHAQTAGTASDIDACAPEDAEPRREAAA